MREQTVLTPSQVGQYIKQWMDRDRLLSGLLISGEISNYKVYPSGHHYFTLKDGEGALRCVMFRGDAASLRFRPSNGMRVIAAGRITVFPRDGQYQLYCVRLTPEGVGDLHLAFEQLKERLAREGLFDPAHKRPLPRFPSTVALITSPAGAAVRDMVRILGARWPLARIRVLPVRVQGEGAAEEIAAALQWANENRVADVIITGRGGGSMEDLWAFNEEVVARAIYRSQIPVISAVGHEPDVTISDFVADLRAATPSNAAELAVPDQGELRERLLSLQTRLAQAETKRLKLWRQEVEKLRTARVLQSPTNYLEDRRLLVDYQQNKLLAAVRQGLLQKKQGYVRLRTALESMSPMGVLARGYAMTRDGAGRVITDSAALHIGDTVTITLRQGEADAAITAIRGGSHGREEDL